MALLSKSRILAGLPLRGGIALIQETLFSIATVKIAPIVALLWRRYMALKGKLGSRTDLKSLQSRGYPIPFGSFTPVGLEVLGLTSSAQQEIFKPAKTHPILEIAEIDLDDNLSIVKAFIPGTSFQEFLADAGIPVFHSELRKLPHYESLGSVQRAAYYKQTVSEGIRSALRPERVAVAWRLLQDINCQDIELHDIKLGNIVEYQGEAYYIDFEAATDHSCLPCTILCVNLDRDAARFNELFREQHPTFSTVSDLIKRNPYLPKPYQSVRIGYGIQIGNLWDPNIGFGKWVSILNDAFRGLPQKKRVLSFGCNFGSIQYELLRAGTEEIVRIEMSCDVIEGIADLSPLVAWADLAMPNFTAHHTSIANRPELRAGLLDLVFALCSLYCLDEEEIHKILLNLTKTTKFLCWQCKVRESIGHDDSSMYLRASMLQPSARNRTGTMPSSGGLL